ncbi:MAG: hypothetical protein V4671_20385, partial [Armatimonadota bacterium]
MGLFSFSVFTKVPLIAASLLINGCLMGTPALAEPPAFAADKIEAFDGRTWGGLTLGVTTQDGVKQQFRNGRGDFSTSVEVKQEKENTVPYRVSALYINKEKNATL